VGAAASSLDLFSSSAMRSNAFAASTCFAKQGEND
jgi:hypothetical protein